MKKIVVKVDCPLAVLEEREKYRRDRAPGVARGQFDGIQKFTQFDIKVDSSISTPQEIASVISCQMKIHIGNSNFEVPSWIQPKSI